MNRTILKKIVKLRNEGKTFRQIQSELGLSSKGMVQYWYNKSEGIPEKSAARRIHSRIRSLNQELRYLEKRVVYLNDFIKREKQQLQTYKKMAGGKRWTVNYSHNKFSL